MIKLGVEEVRITEVKPDKYGYQCHLERVDGRPFDSGTLLVWKGESALMDSKNGQEIQEAITRAIMGGK